LGKIAIGLRLQERRAQLRERAFGLRDLMLDLGRGDLDEQIACLDTAADVDIALGNVAAGARIDVGLLEGFRRAGPGHGSDGVAGADHGRAHHRHKTATGFRAGHHFRVQLKMLPEAVTDRAGKQQKHDERQREATARAAFGRFDRQHVIDRHAAVGEWRKLVHTGSSANTPLAGLPSLRLRNKAKR
jgi:hypothetical protein